MKFFHSIQICILSLFWCIAFTHKYIIEINYTLESIILLEPIYAVEFQEEFENLTIFTQLSHCDICKQIKVCYKVLDETYDFNIIYNEF